MKLRSLRRGECIPGGGWQVNEWVVMHRKGGGGVAGELLLLTRYLPEGSEGYAAAERRGREEERERRREEEEEERMLAAARVLQAMVRAARDWCVADQMMNHGHDLKQAIDSAEEDDWGVGRLALGGGAGGAFWNLPSVVSWGRTAGIPVQ